jgi:hypothetical protein
VYVRYGTDLGGHQVAIVQSTYKVGKFRDLFVTEEIGTTTLRRRCPWGYCLSLAFSPVFRRFMELETSVGTTFGCVARIYLAQHEGDGHLDVLDRTFFMNYTESSYGRGFINAVGETFPELSSPNLRDAMEQYLNGSLSDAKMKLEGCLSYSKMQCGCCSCTGSGRTQNYGCYLGLAATVVDLISTLSAVSIEHEKKIQPTLAGLRRLLDNNTTKMHEKDTETCTRSHRLLHKRRTGKIYNSYDTTKRLELMVVDILYLFTGMDHTYPDLMRPGSKQRTRTAVSSNGMCVFIDGLCLLSTQAELIWRIHAIPGCIAKFSNKEDPIPREYDTISDFRS